MFLIWKRSDWTRNLEIEVTPRRRRRRRRRRRNDDDDDDTRRTTMTMTMTMKMTMTDDDDDDDDDWEWAWLSYLLVCILAVIILVHCSLLSECICSHVGIRNHFRLIRMMKRFVAWATTPKQTRVFLYFGASKPYTGMKLHPVLVL